MITNKFSFSGALGKSQNFGGSKFLSVPHTIDVPALYSINININGDFISCSLNGKLWCFKNSDILTFCALNWNSNSRKLEFAASIVLSEEFFIARGLDWILTDKSFVRGLDEEPYISVISLSSILAVDADNIPADDCFSLLPAIGDFQLVHHILFRRNNNGKALSQIIPLSFPHSFIVNPYVGFIYAYDFLFNQEFSFEADYYSVIVHDGQLWGCSDISFGKVFLLPLSSLLTALLNDFSSISRMTTHISIFFISRKIKKLLRLSSTILFTDSILIRFGIAV